MKNIEFRNFRVTDESAIIGLQHRCVDLCPDTGKFEAGFWLSPRFENGRNIFVAENANAQIVGYAATTSAYYSNKWAARIFWMDLRTDPDIDKNLAIKDALLEKIIQRGNEIKREEKRERAAVGATYFPQGQASIDYLKSRGFTHFESILAMRKKLRDAPIAQFDLVDGVKLKSWRMEAREEKVAYLAARETAFGYPLQTIEILEHFTHSELWQGSTTLTAFAGKEIIASIMTLSNGLLDYVFVVPNWRGKGIAKALISEALQFLQERGHPQAWLEVYAHNKAASSLYQNFGFETFKEEISLGFSLD
jgi:ribosomal protein S18 acetylase RimI-like enzyme